MINNFCMFTRSAQTNRLDLKDAIDYLSTVTNMTKLVIEEHLIQFCNSKIKMTNEPYDINKTISEMANFLDVDIEIAKTVWYKMGLTKGDDNMCKCREDQEDKYSRMISHYDIELRDYTKFLDVLETVADVNPEKVTQLIKDFKKGHKEHSDDNPVEF